MTKAEIEIVKNVENDIRELFTGEFSGHDVLHTLRVVKNARMLNEDGEGDEFIIILACLLHDADDRKLFPETAENNGNARKISEKNGVSGEITERIIDIINSVSFSSGKTPESLEGKIVQDADRLDAIGAVGIARCFSFGGSRNRPMYEEGDFSGESTGESSIAHFYNKLLKLEGLMNTAKGREEAEKRTAFLKSFLERFRGETDITSLLDLYI
ncbi:MAG: HD domain-containing protein [Clostridia bacterium]|nr:HD domain-containing protein [Clostridia bacterium]